MEREATLQDLHDLLQIAVNAQAGTKITVNVEEAPKYLFDSNVIDSIVPVYGKVRNLVKKGEIEIIYTHINIDQLCNIPDPEKRQWLINLLVSLGRFVSTGIAVWGYSRLDFSRFALEETSEVYDAVHIGNDNHVLDAILAATARFEECTLVTNDKKLTGKAKKAGVDVISIDDFLVLVDELSER